MCCPASVSLGTQSAASEACPRMPVRRLLKSCAIPAAMAPRLFIRSARFSRCSRRFRSEISTHAFRTPRTRVFSSNTGAANESTSSTVPSPRTIWSSAPRTLLPVAEATCMGSSPGRSSRPFRVMRYGQLTLSSALWEILPPGGTPSMLASAGFTRMLRQSGSFATAIPIGMTSNSVSKSATFRLSSRFRSRISTSARARRSTSLSRAALTLSSAEDHRCDNASKTMNE